MADLPEHLRDRFFSLPRRLIFNTAAERDFLRERFRADDGKSGDQSGIDPPVHVPTSEFRYRYGLDDPFLLYVGRVSATRDARRSSTISDARARKGD